MDQTSDFLLDGWLYSRKMRKCNKHGCKCQDGDLHGPYWYRSRDGALQYVGKVLPDHVLWRLAALDGLRVAINGYARKVDIEIRELNASLHEAAHRREVLRLLLSGGSLSGSDWEMVRSWGWSTLAPPVLLEGKQDTFLNRDGLHDS